MIGGKPSRVLLDVGTLFNVGTFGGMTDAQLLERFASRRDDAAEVAFAALLARHGPMVWGVCRRALSNPHDAADAFQATFLVLVRKAPVVRVNDSLGRWLYGVSRKVAARARATAVRRSAREDGDIATLTEPASAPERDELLDGLDEEIGRLPERYRAVVVLCDLGGLSHEEAARQLGCAVGTIGSRLNRGRERLRSRLLRRGLVPAWGAFATAIVGNANAAVPAALVNATVCSAMGITPGMGMAGATGAVSARIATLAEGVVTSMFTTKLKMAGLGLLMAGVLATSAGVLAQQGREDDQDNVPRRGNRTSAALRDVDSPNDQDASLPAASGSSARPLNRHPARARVSASRLTDVDDVGTTDFSENIRRQLDDRIREVTLESKRLKFLLVKVDQELMRLQEARRALSTDSDERNRPVGPNQAIPSGISLANKRVAVVTRVAANTRAENPSIDHDLARVLSKTLESYVGNGRVIPPDKVRAWIATKQPTWTNPLTVAEEFDADVTIYLEVEAFQITNPALPQMLWGKSRVHMKVVEVTPPERSNRDKPRTAKHSYDQYVDTEFPRRGPLEEGPELGRSAFMSKFLTVVATDVSKHLVGQQVLDDAPAAEAEPNLAPTNR